MNVKPSFWIVLAAATVVAVTAAALLTLNTSEEERVQQTLLAALDALQSRDADTALATTTEDFSIEGVEARDGQVRAGVQRALDGCETIEVESAMDDLTVRDDGTATVNVSVTTWCQSVLSGHRLALNDLPPVRGRTKFAIHLKKISDRWLIHRVTYR